MRHSAPYSGFTLIELSIVIVIIALIIGGVLVGKDLISAAEIRAQVSQIEKYQTAVNTFRLKYGYLPGDMPDSVAAGFFGARYNPGYVEEGYGDGSGVIAGWWGPGNPSPYATQGETLCFWRDLTLANMVDGLFAIPGANNCSLVTAVITGSQVAKWIPPAKIGNGNYVYVYTGGIANSGAPTGKITNGDGINYFTITAFTALGSYGGGTTSSAAGLTAQQAYAIDSKADDGLPQSGKVTAKYINPSLYSRGAIWAGGTTTGANPGAANSPLSTNCYDNGGLASTVNTYSIAASNNLNCALSFRF